MKVAYLLGSLNRGGAENLILDIFHNSDKAKYGIIGIYRKNGALLGEFQNSGISFINCPVSKGNIIRYLHKLRRILIDNHISIVHAQQSTDALLASIATTGTGIKVILTVHGFYFGLNKTAKLMKVITFKVCDHICFVSHFQYEYYRGQYSLIDSSNSSVLYNGINFSKIPLMLSSQSHKRFQFGTVGSFRPVRDQFFICTFLHCLKRQGIEFDFYFIGSKDASNPTRYDDCVNYCIANDLGTNVHFLGCREDVPQLLSGLDAFIYCSEHDTFGIAVLEAISSGVPVFVNDWGVMSEITENGRLATVYKTGSTEDLFERFSCFICNIEPFRNKANESARYVREKYSIETHLNNLYDIYSKVL